MRAYIIVDLGFGDSGKGVLTDFLVRHFDAKVVVRYNGGAQAGHNVITPDGRHHTFSQFGAGTFIPGVKTILSKDTVIHPGALLIEGNVLESKGVRDAFARLRVSDQALVITPFHQAANRIRELLRGQDRHGSCGIGIGETIEDAQSNVNDCIRAIDLLNPPILRQRLQLIRERKREQLYTLVKPKILDNAIAQEWKIFEREDVIDTWLSSISRIGELGLVVPDSELRNWLHQTETVIFEGAQGVLLDADIGFHPYTTWSRCTAANAYDFIAAMAPETQTFQIGVMRCYAVRHGPGPLPTETNAFASAVFDHNKYNEWQGAVRYGWFDAVLARYALAMTGQVDFLAITHLDVLTALKAWTYCNGYKWHSFDDKCFDLEISNGILSNFRPPYSLSLAQRARFTQILSTITPVLETLDADEKQVIQKIESLVGLPVKIISHGPSAKDVQILKPFRF